VGYYSFTVNRQTNKIVLGETQADGQTVNYVEPIDNADIVEDYKSSATSM